MDLSSLFAVEGKVVLVTGGGRGIGKMIAEGFVHNGAKVYIASRSLQACQDTANELNAQGRGSCIALQADLGSEAGCTALAKEIIANESHLDVLVNNSGVAHTGDILHHSEADWDRVLNINLKAHFFLARDLLPLLDVAATTDGGAHIINVGSISGLQPSAFPSYAYDASKAAVHHLTRVLACKLAKRPNGGKINVNGIAPGVVPTDMLVPELGRMGVALERIEKGIPLSRCAAPSDMAGVALFLASRASAWITGEVIPVDGGQSLAMSSRLI